MTRARARIWQTSRGILRTEPTANDDQTRTGEAWTSCHMGSEYNPFTLAIVPGGNSTSKNEILWDSQKLIVSRAALRVMVINGRTAQVVEQSFDRMIEAIRRYSGI